MATNLALDPELLERALAVSGQATKKAAVTLALREFIARREQLGLLDLVGTLEWDDSFDYKAERARMTVLVDTSVWSLALRRDVPPSGPTVAALTKALESDLVVTTGLIVQELLQGFLPMRTQIEVRQRFGALPGVQPTRDDHMAAADLRNTCRRAGVQLGTIDALIAQLCITHDVELLTTDRDFMHVARHCSLRLWNGSGA